jgi:hypothetical protein
MPSFATFVVFLILALALLVVLPKLRAAESNSVEPLTVRVIPPKSVSAVTPVMAEPLRAPVPSVETIVAFAQQLSISDPTAEVDDLLSSFSSFSMKATLPRSCCKFYPTMRYPIPFRLLCTLRSVFCGRVAACSIHHHAIYNWLHHSFATGC